MNPAHIPKTALVTPFGLYEVLVMSFGLRNAGNTFQRMMDKVTSGLPSFSTYLDDFLVASPDLQSHLRHLRLLLERFRQHGLVINPSNCQFGLQQDQILGHNVSASGIKPLSKYIDVISSFPQPRDKTQLQRFLGLS